MKTLIFDRLDLRKARLARLSHALHERAGGVSGDEYRAICADVGSTICPVTSPADHQKEVLRRLRALDPSRQRNAAR